MIYLCTEPKIFVKFADIRPKNRIFRERCQNWLFTERDDVQVIMMDDGSKKDNVSTKVVKLIQSNTKIIYKMV